MDTFSLIIAAAGVIILSFFFNVISARTKIPSVLLLMVLGIILQIWIPHHDISALSDLLPILGNVGLVMIVLEAALDLKLEKKNLPIITRSFLVATVTLFGSAIAIAFILQYLIPGKPPWLHCLAYAIPLSIMSSAIIIPSVASLRPDKQEFMVYESTFSDILGIMFFYFLMGSTEKDSTGEIILDIGLNLVITLVLAVIVAYGLVLLFQKLKTTVKLFLIIAVLMLMYAVGKKFHLSSLIIILAFGLVLNNIKLFFRGPLRGLVNESATLPIMHDFHTLTLETAFVIRTFFFVIFGIIIDLSSLIDVEVALISGAIVGALYVIRFITMKLVIRRYIAPQIWLAPRGLITILLFFSIAAEHPEFGIPGFDPGILLYTIIITSVIMAIALITDRGEKVREVLITNLGEIQKTVIPRLGKTEEEESNSTPEEPPKEEG